jgi:DNA polymerase V
MKHHKVTGFASPAQGYEMQGIDLNGLLIRRPNATFFFRVEDDDAKSIGIHNGSLLVVDRSIKAKPDDLVLMAHESRIMCCRFILREDEKVFTDGANIFKPIIDDTAILGVVTSAIQMFTNDI